MIRRLCLALLLALVATVPARAWSDGERARVLSLGPWPPAPATDPGNAWAERPAVRELGRHLFFDARLSPDGALACASCHHPARAFADGRPRSLGRMELERNAPSLWNAGHERWMGWDGAADSLWGQAIRPLTDARELASNGAHLRRRVEGDADLACRWHRAFGAPPPSDDEAMLVLVAKALGAFTGSLVSGRTPFDAFRDALERGDKRAMARYPAEAQRGLKLFVGRGRCVACHAGPRLSNGEFGDIGAGFFVRPGQVDPGRHGGILALRASHYNLLSRHADPDGTDASLKTRHVELQHRNFGEFKVPSLRNVALTAPYLHDGRIPTLEAMVRHYSELDLERLHADGERLLEPLHLTATEQRELVAFLRTLSDPGALRWKAPPARPCRARGNH